MFGLPKSTEINRQLPKKAIFEKFKPKLNDRHLFDEQISRLTIIAELSPQTTNIRESEDVKAIYIVLVTLKTVECDKKNIILLSKLIDQNMLFALQFKNTIRFAVYRAERVLFSENKPPEQWEFNLSGHDLKIVWENIIAKIGCIDITSGKSLDETIIENEFKEKLIKQITKVEKKAMDEKQTRRKWELAEEVRLMKEQFKGDQ